MRPHVGLKNDCRTYTAVEEVWQGQESQRVSCGGCVNDYAGEVGVLGALGKLHDPGDGNGLISPRRKVVEEFSCKGGVTSHFPGSGWFFSIRKGTGPGALAMLSNKFQISAFRLQT